MRTTGLEMFFSGEVFLAIREAIKLSKFNAMQLITRGAKYMQMLSALLLFCLSAQGQLQMATEVIVGADRPGAYLPLLYGKSVAVVVNQTSITGHGHLIDFLIESKVDVKKVFAPEHGFRGKASAGELVKDGKDTKTGLPLVSLYGSNKKPSAQQLADVDIVVFDLQDVGTRFYTYISTLSYVMEACAENGKSMVLLDRPNPNGYYVDGPMLEKEHSSFVGLHPIPVVHGLTMGEYAMMLNGEKWIANGKRCPITVVKCTNWDHKMGYELPVKPSPNLPNRSSIVLYPSLCFFEGTTVSVGRGTDKPFQQIGAPYFTDAKTSFTPVANEGAKHPKYEGQKCYGYDLEEFSLFYVEGLGELYLHWLVEAYKSAPDKAKFFTSFFVKLAGTHQLQKDIEAGKTPDDIRAAWQEDLAVYKQMRKKYLLYPDFE